MRSLLVWAFGVAMTLSAADAPKRLFSPGILIFNLPLGGSVTQAQTVDIDSPPPGGTLIDVSIPSPCSSWLRVPSRGIGRQYVVLEASNASIVSAGTQSCLVSLTQNGASIGGVTVILNVGNKGLGTTPNGVAAPTRVTFITNRYAGAYPQTVRVKAGGSFNVGVAYPDSYNVLPGFAQPGFLRATPNLAAGTVQVELTGPRSDGIGKALLYIETDAGTEVVEVNIVGESTRLVPTPADLHLNYQAGAGATSAGFGVETNGSPEQVVTATVAGNWVRLVSPQKQTTPAYYQLAIDPSGLPNGLNTAAVIVKAANTAVAPVVVPVVVMVSGSSYGGGRSTADYSLAFGAQAGGAPVSQIVSITGMRPGNYSAVANTLGGTPGWLRVTPSGVLGTASDPVLEVSVNPAGMASGNYSGSISLAGAGIQQSIPVTLSVTAGVLPAVTPQRLTFVWQQGTPVPAPQPYTIAISGGSSGIRIAVSASTSNGINWLSAGSSNVTVSSSTTLYAAVMPGQLPPGQYSGEIVLKAANAAPVSIPVALTVEAARITSSHQTLSFQFRQGESAPAAQTVQISGAAGQAFSAKATSAGNWLSVTPASGTLAADGARLTISADPARLGPGTHDGVIEVSAPDGGAAAVQIRVTLTVAAGLATITKVANAGSYADGSLAPGEIVTIFGTYLGPETGVSGVLDAAGRLATSLGGVETLIGGFPAPLIYVSSGQVSAIVPYEIANSGRPDTTVLVRYGGQSSNGFRIAQAEAAPGIFTANSSGAGPGAILNSDYTANGPSTPAGRGDIVQVFFTGAGQTDPPGATGEITTVSATGPLTPKPVLPVTATIDGQPAVVQFCGGAPNQVSGLIQLNLVIPANARAGEVPLTVTVGNATSQAGVTVSVK